MSSISEFYEQIFNPIFLIRYGYYDFKIKKLPKEHHSEYSESEAIFRDIFNMDDFALVLQEFGDDLMEMKNEFFLEVKPEDVKNTEPIYFSIPKNGVARRQLKFPNLYNYTTLVLFLNENKNEFIDVFIKNKNSTSKYFNLLGYKYEKTQKIQQQLLFNGKKRLYLDLSNYYHTLYTHSIPWVIMGKNNAKKNRKTGFSNELDKLLQRAQYGETYGIPTGNLISRIVAELYMCYIDMELEKHKNAYTYARYVDDIIFPFNYEEESIMFYQNFQQLCEKYNLIVNDKKTRIEEFPFVSKNDKSAVFSFLDTLNKNVKNHKWIERISNFIDFCISEEARGNKGSIKVIFTSIEFKISANLKSKSDLEEIFTFSDDFSGFNLFSKILDVSLINSNTSNKFIELAEILIKKGISKARLDEIVGEYFLKNKKKIEKQIIEYSNNFKNYELYQLLLYCVYFNNKDLFSKKTLLSLIDLKTDDFSLVLIFILIYRNNDSGMLNEALKKIEELFKSNNKNYGGKAVFVK